MEYREVLFGPFKVGQDDKSALFKMHLIGPSYRFVSSLHIPSFSPSHLISGGGDEYLNIFTYTSGSLINQIAILSYAQAWIKVKGGRKKWKRSERGRWGRNREREREGEGEGEDVEMEEEDSFVVKKIESFEWMDERWLIYSAVG
jgi:hypothetical protein